MILLREMHTVATPTADQGTRGPSKMGSLHVYMDKASQIGGGNQVLHMFVAARGGQGEWYVPVMFIGNTVKAGKPTAPIGTPPDLPLETVQQIAKQKAEEIIEKSAAETQKIRISESEFASRILVRIMES